MSTAYRLLLNAGERGVPFEPGDWAQADSDVFHDPVMGATQSGLIWTLPIPSVMGRRYRATD